LIENRQVFVFGSIFWPCFAGIILPLFAGTEPVLGPRSGFVEIVEVGAQYRAAVGAAERPGSEPLSGPLSIRLRFYPGQWPTGRVALFERYIYTPSRLRERG
jgi:hypothetical protein